MGTYNPNCKSTYNLLRGLWGLISTVIIGGISVLNLQVQHLEVHGMFIDPIIAVVYTP